jgi:4'-phosphopantetheinyl transferase EntD
LWPRGATGSISHCADLCVVVVARRTRFLALGVDVEVADPLEAELWSTVCTPRELDLLDGIRETERGRLVRVLFSAKESIYKCVRAAQGPELAFHDIELRLEPGRGRFAARWRKASEGDGCPRGRCSGRYALRGRWIFTGVSFPASQPAPRWPGL